jgi:hypothetical protein
MLDGSACKVWEIFRRRARLSTVPPSAPGVPEYLCSRYCRVPYHHACLSSAGPCSRLLGSLVADCLGRFLKSLLEPPDPAGPASVTTELSRAQLISTSAQYLPPDLTERAAGAQAGRPGY